MFGTEAGHLELSGHCVTTPFNHFCKEKPDAAEDLDEAWDENGFGVRVAVVLGCRPLWVGYNPVWRHICVCSLIHWACHLLSVLSLLASLSIQFVI